ncbi:threonyl-tRNA synthetase [Tumebacillus sp. BK434]|uniref:threonine--tRNA ligase n=1 Tax=Tumebacillus sp. BK434 TaxID=2512169 RepID=UPI0010E7F501|nr:threonine--tRNA ligase [Tumebacillus sp. BK434]TCP52740.1 threonyl-tRNA synthetase [Tumebacillus sp. BK434]
MSINITLPDGSVRSYEGGQVTPAEVAASIGKGLAKAALAAKVDGRLVDLSHPIKQDAEIAIVTWDSAEGHEVFWHTSTHIMAQAVKRLFPDAQLTVGPTLDEGYFYDIDTPRTLTPEDVEKIEAEMKKIVDADFPIERKELSREDAITYFTSIGELYKVEIIKDLPEDEVISAYTQGEFTDLCYGPHLPSTGKLKAWKITNIAGAYWRGDQNNKQLQRLYGVSYPSQKELDQYIFRIEEAKKRDHRRLGKELGLFSLREESPAIPFWLPKGRVLWNTLRDWSYKTQLRLGYQEINTPQVLKVDLFHQSGHYDFYKENMYFMNQDGTEYGLKPMNCPAHCLVFSEGVHSYRDLPIRYSEYERLHRWEYSGAVHGLMRVRGLCQDDAHLFCTEEQIESEIMGVLKLLEQTYTTLGLKFKVKLSTRPEEFMGDIELWNKAEATLERTLNDIKADWVLNPGDGAFYGPKLDFDVTDSLGRTWQCATLQLDFQLPLRFNLTYVDRDGGHKNPIIIHRAIFGSIERFIGILIEHFAGAFPTWLAPEQVRILAIADRHVEFAEQVKEKLLDYEIRATVDSDHEKIGYKIRNGQLQKVPYMLVVGDREAETNSVSVRSREAGDLGSKPVDEFIADILQEIKEKRLSQSHLQATEA